MRSTQYSPPWHFRARPGITGSGAGPPKNRIGPYVGRVCISPKDPRSPELYQQGPHRVRFVERCGGR